MRPNPLRFFWLLLAAIGLLGQTGIQAGTISDTNLNLILPNSVAPPTITTQPVSQTVCSTSPVSFSVAATNASSYRWQVSYDNTFNFPSNLGNTGVYSGADTPVLTISSVSDLNGAYFRCVVTNGGESTNSEGVLLTVTTLSTATIFYSNPLFCSLDGNQTGINRSGIGGNGGTYSSRPSGLSLTSDFGRVTPGNSLPGSYTVTYTIPARGGCPVVTATTALTITTPPIFTGNSVEAVTQPTCGNPTGTISVTATGSGTIEYSRNGTDWQSSATFSELTPGGYTIRVRSSDNLTCSRNITFTIYAPSAPAVSNPVVTTATTGSAFSRNFTASSGTGPYSYSLASGTPPTGLTLETTGVLSGTPTQGGSFTITVQATGSNGCSGVGSPYVLDVTNIPAVVINTGPVSQSVCSTNPASFSVDATNATSYQWQRSADNTFNFPSNLSNSGVYSGADTPVLTISSISGLSGYYFRCVVSNAGGPVNTTGAMLTMTTLPTATIFYSSPLLCTTGGSVGSVSRSGNNSNGGVYTSSPSSLSIASNTGTVTPGSSTPGSYTVTYTVAASGGCPVVTATTTLTVTAPPTSAGSSTTQPTCAIPTGTISVTATGSGTIEYSRNGTDWQTSGLFSGLDPGSYVIRIRSSNNLTCTRNLGFTINSVPSGPTVTNPALTTATVGTPFSRSFTAASGTAPYTYSLASGSLPNGVTLSTAGTLSGTATESGSFTITVRATGNNGCSGVGSAYILTVGEAPSADLSISKTDGVSSLVPGVPTTYTITVGNAGPLAVTGATVTDIFPASITSVAWTATFTGGASGTASGTGNISQTVNLPVGSSVTYQAVCATNPASTGTLTNTATVTLPGGITDPNSGNNSATDVNALAPEVDLAVTLSGSPDPVAAGNRLTYTIQATNNGPGTAGSVQISIPLSTSITFYSLSTPGGWSCTTPSVGATGTVSCSQASFPTGGTASFTLVVTTAPGSEGSTLMTSATISSGTTDVNPSNNEASVNTPVVSGNANLSNLTLTPGSLSTAFFASVVSYSATVGHGTSSLTVTPTAANSNATIQVRVNGGSFNPVTSGTASDPLALTVGANPIDVLVTAEDDVTTKNYRVIVTRGVETPLIDTQPVSQTVCSTSPVSVSVEASNATGYQWQIAFDNTFNFPNNLANSGVYSGADTPVLTISSASGLDGRYYRCVVSNGGGSTNSDAVLLTVTTLPTAAISYNSTVFCGNTNAVGLVTRSGIGSNGGTYSSVPSSLSINPGSGTVIPTYSPAGSYTITYSVPANGGCPVVTATTALTITALPTLTGSAVTHPTCATSTGTISVSATGSGTIEYSQNGTDWQPGGVFSGLDPGSYIIQVRSSINPTCTLNLSFSVNEIPSPPSAVINPSSETLTCASPTVSLTASGGNTYRWEDSSTNPIRAITSAGTYSVTVTAGNGCAATASVQINSNVVVLLAPNLTSTTVMQGAPPVTLTADNCAGTITWTGPGGSSGTGPITVTTASPGTFGYVAACTTNGCVSDPTSVTVVVTAPVITGSFDGFIYGADCATFRGWAWDRNKPNTAISIDILEGSTVIATLMASEFRQDLLDQGKGNGRHAFFWPIPENLKDGLPHSLSARVTGNPFVLKDSPKVLICLSNPEPGGNKPPRPPVPTVLIAPVVAQVGVPFSGTLVAFTDPENGSLTYAVTGLPAGLSLEMPNRIISGTPTQSGTFVLTYQATDNQGATNSVSFQLTVNPAETTTVTGNFEGYLDKLDCGGIRGWVWDRNKPNTPLTVEFYTENSPGNLTVLGSSLANIYRTDLKDAGKGNGAHAYNFTPPGSVTNSTLVLARVLGSNYLLKGSPKAYQCAGARLSAEPKSDFQVILLGNPIAQDVVEMEIRGAEGESLQIQVTDATGHLVRELRVPESGAIERHQVSVARQAPGILVLRVSTSTQTKTVKVLKTK